jgi:hypothetical protein
VGGGNMLVLTKKKQKKDFTIAVCSFNNSYLVWRKGAEKEAVDFFILGPQWKVRIDAIKKLHPDKRRKLLNLLSKTGVFVQTSSHYYQIAVYIEKELKRKKKTEKSAEENAII